MLKREWLLSLSKELGQTLLGLSAVGEPWEAAGMRMAQGIFFIPSKSHPGTQEEEVLAIWVETKESGAQLIDYFPTCPGSHL